MIEKMIIFIDRWITSRQKKSSASRRTRFTSTKWFQHRFLKKINLQYVFAYSLLIFALLYQSNPSFRIAVNTSFGSMFGEQPTVVSLDAPQLWPWSDNTLHQAVVNMPPNIETSINSVAQYIAQQEPDPYLRIKALHDYVADRIVYDTKALALNIYPPQDAQTVFRTRKAVCAGYSNLLTALGKAIGEKIVTIEGDIRKELAPEEVVPFAAKITRHAWNAAKIEGNWYLIDVTWDSSSDINPIKSYSTDYLMIAPEALIKSHFPDRKESQLLLMPVSKRVFEKQPLLQPSFFAHKLQLISPNSYQNDVKNVANITLENPQQSLVVAGFVKDNDNSIFRLSKYKIKNQKNEIKLCEVKLDSITDISCHFPQPGNYTVSLYQYQMNDNEFDYLGELKYKSI